MKYKHTSLFIALFPLVISSYANADMVIGDGGGANSISLGIQYGGLISQDTFIVNNNGAVLAGGWSDDFSQEMPIERWAWAVVNNTVVNKGGAIYVEGGVVNNTLIDGGRMLVLGATGGNAANLQYFRQGELSVANDTIIKNGGLQYVYNQGTANNSQVSDQGRQNVYYDGVANNTIVNSGGLQYIYYNGESNNTIINEGGKQYVYSTDKVSGTVVKKGGEQYVYFPASLPNNVGLVKNTLVEAGGFQSITGVNVSALDTMLYGEQRVFSDGSSVNTTVGDGGLIWAYAKGNVLNANILSGGNVYIDALNDATTGNPLAPAYANNTILNGGALSVRGLDALAENSLVNSGELFVHNGGIIMDTRVAGNSSVIHIDSDSFSKGRLDLSSGATVYLGASDTSGAKIEHLTLNDASVIFGSRDGSDAGQYNRLELISLSGNGTFVMNTNINGGQGDFLSISDPLDVNSRFNVKVMDSGVELKRSVAGVDPYHLIYANSSNAEHFTLLNGSVDLGAYKYYLVQGDDTDTDNWYLSPTAAPVEPGDNGGGTVTPNPRPELSDGAKAAISMANVTPTIWDGELSTLRTRLGDLRDDRSAQNGTWGKYITSRYRVSTDNVGYRQDMNGVMLGGDRAIELQGSRLLIGGLFSYTHSKLDSRSGDGKVDSYGLGVYTTWMHDSGYYVDGVLKANRFKTENNANFNGGKTSGSDNTNGFGASVEVGKHIKLDSYFVEPYIMGSAFRGGKTSYELDSGMKAKADSAQSLKTEVGTTFGHAFVLDGGAVLKPYLRLAVSHEFQKNNDVIINDTERFSNDMSGTVGKYGVGLTAQLDNQWSTYGEINYSNGSHIETPYSGHLGIRYSF
ncbi:Adhesin/invasin TibA autotransporter precursor [Pragia fontium]|uniref:autotransporter outer membrane beta-barrel domain-containing protein n=1 Tax=Pragia fontium TaxID=82985 RepID=UPI000E06E193|nr:autotransporter outer membrane beta-barrel domain-containing protein [Pragia fontium]SUB82760.1 Adhesin/invasin TibA autotransporter precursor [Pragia fontium]